jgi:cell division protein FtsI (penicillin-binding protein 3)
MSLGAPPSVPPPPVALPPRRPLVAAASDGRRRGQLDTLRTRLAVGAGVFGLMFLALAARVVDVTLLAEGQPRVAATPQAVLAAKPRVERASIVDRNGVLLAASLPTAALYANPREIADPMEAARKLATALPDLDPALLAPRLEGDRQFVWIRRHLTPHEQDAVNRLGIPGMHFQRAERRAYPQGSAAVHVLGGTDVDGNGIAGVERQFDARLRAEVGTPLRLSLDIRVQHVLREALARAIDRFEAIGGAAVVMDVNTGEVLAMVSLPDYDPAEIATAPAEARFNRITVGVYEPGSTFKLLSTGMALDLGTTRLTGGYDASRPITFGRFTISDFRGKNRWLTVPEIFAYSSNIGTARMVLEVGVPRHRAFLETLGMTRRLGIELPEAAVPLAPSPRNWREINTLTIAFGHGISVTPLHVASATAAMVNGGVLFSPTLLARDTAALPPVGEGVIRAETSATLRRLMRLAVTHGSGRRAEVPGYFVGGKTGTAQKVDRHGRYLRDARISSFTGIFPAHAPRYVVYLMIDEPRPQRDTHGFATGGWVAAPAAREVIERIGPLLGIVPEPETETIRAALAITLPGQAPARPAAAPATQRQAALSAPERRVAAQ